MTGTRDEATPPPLPVRATSLWQFQTDAAVTAVDLDRRSGNVLVGDKGGALYLLDASGTTRTRHELSEAPCGVAWSRGGFWVVSTARKLQYFDLEGQFLREVPKGEAHTMLATGPRGLVATAPQRGAVHVVGEAGKLEGEVRHEIAALAFCSRDGSLIAAGPYGELSLLEVTGELRWSARLRSHVAGLGASLVGWFVVGTYNEGAVALDDRGKSLGRFAPETTLETCASSPEASHVCLQGADGVLYYLDFRTGYCLWQQKLSPCPIFLRVSRQGRRVLTATSAGSVEVFDFSSQDDDDAHRGDFLELQLREKEEPANNVWKRPAAVFRTPGPFAIAPSGSFIAVTNGNTVEILGKRGQPIRSIRSRLRPRELAVGLDDGFVFVRSYRGAAVLSVEDGTVNTILEPCDTIAASRGDRFVALVGESPPGARHVALFHGAAVQWKTALPSTGIHLTADDDLSLVGVTCENDEFYCLDGSGQILGHRPVPPRCQPPLIAQSSVFATDGPTDLPCYDAKGRLLWTARPQEPLTLFRLGDEVFGRQEDNLFLRLASGGELQPVDPSENPGRSHLLHTEPGDIVELNIDGHTVTCFDLTGTIMWRFEAKAEVSPSRIAAGRGLVAVRTKARVYLLNIGDSAGDAGRARGSFIEI